jgi:hypothetical protein
VTADLVVIVPSRGRPDAARELAKAFEETCTADTQLVLAVDDDDPQRNKYLGNFITYAAPNRNMVEALNRAVQFALVQQPVAVGFMGDDHRPRTESWDKQYLEALRELGTGLVYGNDLLQGERLPTQVAMTVDIVRTLGWMAPPTLTHLYVDDFWSALGKAVDRIRYLPDVVVEHVHPIAHKAEWDEGYARVNSQAMYARDQRAFFEYMRLHFVADVEKVQALL